MCFGKDANFEGILSVSFECCNFGTCSNWEWCDLDLITTVMQDLKSEMTFVIKEADKGSAVVVWDRDDYSTEAYRQLNNISV